MWWMFFSRRKVCASTYVTGNSEFMDDPFYIFEFSVFCTVACTGQGKQSMYLVYTSEIKYTIPNYFTRLHKLHVCVYWKVFNASDTLNIRMNYEMKKFWKIYLLNYAKIYCFTDFLTPYILYIIIMHIWIAQDNHILCILKKHTQVRKIYICSNKIINLYMQMIHSYELFSKAMVYFEYVSWLFLAIDPWTSTMCSMRSRWNCWWRRRTLTTILLQIMTVSSGRKRYGTHNSFRTVSQEFLCPYISSVMSFWITVGRL